jgi:NAD(P)-dependent dehydrogenase (short-subunit alcohol dehydrogenase family)
MPTNTLLARPGAREETAARTPAQRNGFPQDVNEAVLFFASDAADFVHGASLVVDGGILAGP